MTTDEANAKVNGAFPELTKEEDELVEKEIRDRFKRMCEGYFENVAKKLVNEHTVRLMTFPVCVSCLSPFAASARTGQAQPRSIHPLGRDIRRQTTGIREDDEELRETPRQLSDVSLSCCSSL